PSVRLAPSRQIGARRLPDPLMRTDIGPHGRQRGLCTKLEHPGHHQGGHSLNIPWRDHGRLEVSEPFRRCSRITRRVGVLVAIPTHCLRLGSPMFIPLALLWIEQLRRFQISEQGTKMYPLLCQKVGAFGMASATAPLSRSPKVCCASSRKSYRLRDFGLARYARRWHQTTGERSPPTGTVEHKRAAAGVER